MQAVSNVELVVMVKSTDNNGTTESVRQRKITLKQLPNKYINEALHYMVNDLTGPVIAEVESEAPAPEPEPEPTNLDQLLNSILGGNN